MRRWNGWGNDAVTYPLTDAARVFLRQRIGEGTAPRDAAREESLCAVGPSRVRGNALFDDDAALRLDRSRGQSFPDWLQAEKDVLDMGLIHAMAREFDQRWMINPGKRFADA